MRIRDSLIINIPVFLALLLSLTSLAALILFRSRFPLPIVFGVISWQALCGAVMLLIDYRKRKIALFFRVLDSCENENKLNLLTKPLRNTFCGELMRLAIMSRFKETAVK